MLNDPASTRHLIEMNERMIAERKSGAKYRPGVVFFSGGNTEPTITVHIPKIHIVNSITRYPDGTFKTKTEEAFLDVANANKWIDEQVFDETDETWRVFQIVTLDVADYEPPNLLIDSVPEYSYSELREQNAVALDDYVAALADALALQEKIGELAHKMEIEEMTREQAKAELETYLKHQEQNVTQNVTRKT